LQPVGTAKVGAGTAQQGGRSVESCRHQGAVPVARYQRDYSTRGGTGQPGRFNVSHQPLGDFFASAICAFLIWCYSYV
jgi:hypothetical protein